MEQCENDIAQVEVTGDLVRRTILLHDVIHDDKVKIMHWQYMTWPDHGVPRSSKAVRQLVRLLNESGATEKDERRPPIIHCSAGNPPGKVMGSLACFAVNNSFLLQVHRATGGFDWCPLLLACMLALGDLL